MWPHEECWEYCNPEFRTGGRVLIPHPHDGLCKSNVNTAKISGFCCVFIIFFFNYNPAGKALNDYMWWKTLKHRFTCNVILKENSAKGGKGTFNLNPLLHCFVIRSPGGPGCHLDSGARKQGGGCGLGALLLSGSSSCPVTAARPGQGCVCGRRLSRVCSSHSSPCH